MAPAVAIDELEAHAHGNAHTYAYAQVVECYAYARANGYAGTYAQASWSGRVFGFFIFVLLYVFLIVHNQSLRALHMSTAMRHWPSVSLRQVITY